MSAEEQITAPDATPEPKATPEQRLAAHFARTRGLTEPEPDSPEPTDEPEPEPEATPEPEAKQKAEASDDDDAEAVESIGDLARVLGVDVAELYNVKVPVTTPDGERAEVSLSEWKDAYQSSTRAQKLASELESKRAAMEAAQSQAQARIQEQLTQTGALLNAAERQLLSDYQSVDWNELKAVDPGEWAARRQDFLERRNAIETAKAEALAEVKRMQDEQSSQLAEKRKEVLTKEAAALVAAVPEWRDETKARAEQAQLVEYLVSKGFDPADVGSVADHRVVVLARKAMLFDKMQSDGGAAKKKLVKVAKRTIKPGAADSKAHQAQEREAQLKARLAKTGREEDAFALLKYRRSR